MKNTSVLEPEQSEGTALEGIRRPARVRGATDNEMAAPRELPAAVVGAVTIGKLLGFSESGEPLINFDGNKSGVALPARTTVALNASQVGGEIVLTFEDGRRTKPIVLGCLQSRGAEKPTAPVEVKLDGQQLVLSAEHELVLRCGKASLTLTRAGKVLIRGAYLLSRSSGVNRIKGGSVQIN